MLSGHNVETRDLHDRYAVVFPSQTWLLLFVDAVRFTIGFKPFNQVKFLSITSVCGSTGTSRINEPGDAPDKRLKTYVPR